MEEETIVDNDTTTVEEGIAQDTQETDAPALTVDDYNREKERADKLEEANRKLYARIKAKPEPKPLETAPSNDRLGDLELKLELKDRGIPLEAMPFIKKNGGIKGLEDPLVKTAVETYTNQLKAEQAVEGEGATKSELEKRFTLAEMEKMPLEELEKLVQ